ncbi:glycoside hydrolase domain-containing protein [Marinicrinis lubricantis]|uniref:Glycoside hydrolase domain-containing protein n=1 Tax=Marinicrinis lubricantis TaxID=2086470 RepID=A0ABW1IN69_9BACL
MKNWKRRLYVSWICLLGCAIILISCSRNSSEPEPQPAPNEPSLYWGIDTASIIDSSFYRCVEQSFGKPAVAGRYLGTKDGVSHGMTAEEVQLLHGKDIKILLIHNHFNDARGYRNGKDEAREAIENAQKLGVPEGIALFADIEPDYPVDADFIRGWVEAISPSPYEPGIYGDFSQGSPILSAYNGAVNANPKIGEITILWAYQPQVGVTTQKSAPDYAPEVPQQSNGWIWQYGIDSEICNIDTNLIRKEAMAYLW